MLTATTQRTPVRTEQRISRSTWHVMFFDYFFATAAIIYTAVYLIEAFLPGSYKAVIYSTPVLWFLYIHSFWIVGLLFGAAFSFYWQKKHNETNVSTSAKRQAYLRTIIRYCLCFLIAQYGVMKLLGIQFHLGLTFKDMPVTELNGFLLTWYYFGFSWPLVTIIAVLEVGGAVLLLFRRTTLLGAFILLPVMVNIVFVNYFYNIPVVLPSLFMTSGLLYFILLHWKQIKQLLLNTADYFPEISKGARSNALRFGVVFLAFATQVQWATPLRTEKADTVLQGKWKVDQQLIDGTAVPADAWAADSTVSIWSNLYLEDGWFSISNNPYYFDSKRAKHANYTYDATSKALEVKFMEENGKQDVYKATVVSLEGDKLKLQGKLKENIVELALTRVKPVSNHRVYFDW